MKYGAINWSSYFMATIKSWANCIKKKLLRAHSTCTPFIQATYKHFLVSNFNCFFPTIFKVEIMISDTTLKYWRWYIRGGEWLRISVFTWDKSLGFGITKSKLTWFIVITLQAYLLMQFCFEVSQLYSFAGDPTEPLPNYMKLLSQCITRVVGTLVTVDVCLYGKNKAAFINQIILLNKRFKGTATNFPYSFVWTLYFAQ